MAIAAKISSAELTAQVTDRFVDQYFEARLINAPGITYEPGITNDTTFLANEAIAGDGGYQRQVIQYTSGDVSAYSDDGVALNTKATVFAQDGSVTAIPFTHAVLVWSDGNTATLGAVTSAPSAGVDGVYENIPIDATSGSGTSLTVNLTITNSGASAGDYALTIVSAGRGYAAADTLTINDGTLAGLGAITGGAGDLVFSVGTIAPSSGNADQILSVAQTSSTVILAAGNEAAFYWNLKQFGYYSVSA